MPLYDIALIGHVSKDIIIDRSKVIRQLGGAVVYSSAAAMRSGARVFVLTKAAPADADVREYFRSEGIEATILPTTVSTSIQNTYESDDRELRNARLVAQAEAFTDAELEGIEARVFHLAGLFAGEVPESFAEVLAGRGKVALDAQGVVRRSEGGRLVSCDWESKQRFLPSIAYLKTDAAEAEVLTGTSDRERAACILHDLGTREVMVTHNIEVLVFDGRMIHRAPFTARNLSGRTGRGDTCFAAYLAWRLGHDVDESVRYAAALTSIKMETPGPFGGSVQSVKQRMVARLSAGLNEYADFRGTDPR